MLDTSHTTGGEAGDDETQRQSTRLALRLSAEEATQWCRLGFQVEDDSQDQRAERGAEQILQIDDAADFAGSLDLTCIA